MIPKYCALYRHFDQYDQLLYVGISVQPIVRLYQHQMQSEWYDEIVRVEIERFPSPKEARAAEMKAIKDEKPVFNIWTDVKKGVGCRSEAIEIERRSLIKRGTELGIIMRGNSCLGALQQTVSEAEKGNYSAVRQSSAFCGFNPGLIDKLKEP